MSIGAFTRSSLTANSMNCLMSRMYAITEFLLNPLSRTR